MLCYRNILHYVRVRHGGQKCRCAFTDDADGLLTKIKKLIDRGHITTWSYNIGGDFTHALPMEEQGVAQSTGASGQTPLGYSQHQNCALNAEGFRGLPWALHRDAHRTCAGLFHQGKRHSESGKGRCGDRGVNFSLEPALLSRTPRTWRSACYSRLK